MILIQRNWGKPHGGVAPVWVWEDGQGGWARRMQQTPKQATMGTHRKQSFKVYPGTIEKQNWLLAASENANEGQSEETKKL